MEYRTSTGFTHVIGTNVVGGGGGGGGGYVTEHPKFVKNENKTTASTVRLPVPGHFYSCVVSKYLLRENEISFSLLPSIITPLNNESQFV